MTDDLHDFSHLEAHLAAQRRALILREAWKPMAAGAAGAAMIIAAVVTGEWVAGPRFSIREIEVPKVVLRDAVVPNIVSKDVTVPNIITKDVEITVPRIVTTSPLARTPEERFFTSTEDWRAADVRGRIEREQTNGFVLATEDRGEQLFRPARIAPDGKVEPNTGVKDDVAGLIGDLAYCRPAPPGIFICMALHAGKKVIIPQVPLEAPL
jgi:hypothetical protein